MAILHQSLLGKRRYMESQTNYISTLYLFQKSELPTGQKFVSSSSILIHSVRREHAGVFVCMADNGVGNQAKANINLTVLCKFKSSKLFSLHTSFSYQMHQLLRLRRTYTPVLSKQSPGLMSGMDCWVMV